MVTNGALMVRLAVLAEPAEDQPLSMRKMMMTIARIANAAMIRWKMSLNRIDVILAERRFHENNGDINNF